MRRHTVRERDPKKPAESTSLSTIPFPYLALEVPGSFLQPASNKCLDLQCCATPASCTVPQPTRSVLIPQAECMYTRVLVLLKVLLTQRHGCRWLRLSCVQVSCAPHVVVLLARDAARSRQVESSSRIARGLWKTQRYQQGAKPVCSRSVRSPSRFVSVCHAFSGSASRRVSNRSIQASQP